MTKEFYLKLICFLRSSSFIVHYGLLQKLKMSVIFAFYLYYRVFSYKAVCRMIYGIFSFKNVKITIGVFQH